MVCLHDRVGPLFSLLLLLVAGGTTAGCIGVSQTRTSAGGPGEAASELKTCRAGTRVPEDGLIDDFEDGNTQSSLTGGRDGYWWPKKDESGSTIGPDPFAPSEGGADGTEMAMRAEGKTASGGEAWGAGFGVNFTTQKGVPYDASKYVGITFKARVDEKSTRKVRFKIGDANTHKDVGICITCWNHFGKDLNLTPKWKEYIILFTEARQEDGWGNPRVAKVTPSKLVSLDWSIGTGQDYDVWVDDVALLECK